ncbi:DUF190 domain-containing protein [Legionella saoudiensis]|uniref:DUF190 domain-containing protein n=1 Tax=Legionella saoudiensis TaxID=1750561 RepID=UPI0007308568|nr:DUF190 domain-containing protein [Legionella saoudiensis]
MNCMKVSIYINESDKWKHRPLHLELMSMLDEEGIAGGTVLRAIAGFTYMKPVETASFVDIGAHLPLVVQFIDTAERVESILPKIKEMSGTRLVIREPVEVVNGMLATGPIS